MLPVIFVDVSTPPKTWWFSIMNDVRHDFLQKPPRIIIYIYSLSQWLNFKLFGITYLVGKIKFKLFFQGPLAEWVYIYSFIWKKMFSKSGQILFSNDFSLGFGMVQNVKSYTPIVEMERGIWCLPLVVHIFKCQPLFTTHCGERIDGDRHSQFGADL